MSPVFRDSHPKCVRCRGRKCSSTATCDICRDWSLAQWESFHNKRSYAEHSKSSSRHCWRPHWTNNQSPTNISIQIKSRVTPLLPQRGLGWMERRGMKTLNDHVCPPLPRCPEMSREREGGTRTGGWLRMGMRLPLHHLRRGESALPQPSPIVAKATLSPRPNGQRPHSYRPRSDNWSGGDENRSRS